VIKKKILDFALNNWKEILLIISFLAVVAKTQMDYRAVLKAHEVSKNEMKLQIQSLRDIHAEELQKREQALESYRLTLEQIQQGYLKSQSELEAERQNYKKKYVKQFSQDKEALANEIIRTFNFEYVE